MLSYPYRGGPPGDHVHQYLHGLRHWSVNLPCIGPHCYLCCARGAPNWGTSIPLVAIQRPPGGARAETRVPCDEVCDKPYPSPHRLNPIGGPGICGKRANRRQVVQCPIFYKGASSYTCPRATCCAIPTTMTHAT